MAAVVLYGFITNIHYVPSGAVIVSVAEFKKGYTTKEGVRVNDRCDTWRCAFRKGMRDYINKHFGERMYVEVIGDILPYATDDGMVVDGYSFIGKTINISSLPRLYAKDEQKLVKDSQLHVGDMPDIDDYNQPDF